jgi:hypothetical protein
MPLMPVPQLAFLGSVLAAFGAFSITLIGVSLHTMAKRSPGEPLVAHQVIPAKRTEALHARPAAIDPGGAR